MPLTWGGSAYDYLGGRETTIVEWWQHPEIELTEEEMAEVHRIFGQAYTRATGRSLESQGGPR